MNSSIHAIIFDFGGVLINWDPHKLFNKYFANDRQAIDDFLAEINFSAWNLAQDKGYPFARGRYGTLGAIPAICASHPRLR